MSAAVLWFLLAIALLIGEVITTAFLLAPLAIAALFSAGVAWAGGAVWMQALVFAIASIGLVVYSRPLVYRLLPTRGSGARTGIAALIGAEARVTEAIEATSGAGRVKVRGDDWRAVSESGTPIPQGAQVLVVDVEGTTLHVIPHP